MHTVGAFEAKNKFGQLLDWIENGEEVLITRHGREVAKIVPSKPMIDREASRKAVQEIRKMRKKAKIGKFDWAEWKTYRDAGRP